VASFNNLSQALKKYNSQSLLSTIDQSPEFYYSEVLKVVTLQGGDNEGGRCNGGGGNRAVGSGADGNGDGGGDARGAKRRRSCSVAQ